MFVTVKKGMVINVLLELVGRGLLIGLVFGVPAGAIGALTIQRTLSDGFWHGFLTGLGSSFADVIYASAGIFGITLITDFLQQNEMILNICGAILIFIYGIIIFRKKADYQKEKKTNGMGVLSAFASAFSIAIVNPATVISFLIAFQSLGLVGQYTMVQGTAIVGGVLLGTGIWWLALSAVTNKCKTKITETIMEKLNHILGSLLMIFAIVMGCRCFNI